MNVPAKALLYPVLLCLFLGLLVLVTDCAIAKSRKNERANLDKITLSVIDSMPEAHSEEVRDYQNAIRRLGNEYRNYVSESERKYENMMDYYTVWAHQIKTPISSMKLAFQGEDSTLSRRLSVDLFRIEQYVETVVLLSHKKADSYIHIDVEFGEGEGKIPVDSIAKRAEAYKPKEKVTYKMIKEYIEAKYGFKVHTAYIAEVKRNLGLPMYDAPNAVEELKQPRKHPTPEKVEAIKDALRYFAVI
jgi:hypothetical protein